MQAALPFVVALAVTGGFWAVMSLLNNKKTSRAAERLEEIRNPGVRTQVADVTGANSEGMKGLLQKAAPTLSKAVQPKSELEQSKLRVDLANAGYSNPSAPQIFLAIRGVCMGVGLFAGLGSTLTLGLTRNGVIAMGVGVAIGMFGPSLFLRIQASSRIQRLFLQMPDALDMMVVCCEAGLGLDAAMKKVSDEMETVCPDMCTELKMALAQLNMGSPRREVLNELAVRTGLDDMRRLATVLIQADRFGTGMAGALRMQSDEMRTRRRQMAEEKAQKAAVKLILPLVLFIFPGIFVVLVGPAAVMMSEQLLNR